MLLAMHWTDWFWIWITARLPTLFIYQFWKGRKQKKGNFIISSFIIRQTSSRTKWHHSFLVLFATEQLLPHFCVSSPFTTYSTCNILFLQRLKMKQTDTDYINHLKIRYTDDYTFINFWDNLPRLFWQVRVRKFVMEEWLAVGGWQATPSITKFLSSNMFQIADFKQMSKSSKIV